jgi:serine/threonine-protein kinase RsbW
MELRLPSRLEYLSVVDKLVEGVCEILELGEDQTIAVVTSAIEACTNAIQHGHQYDAGKDFTFSVELDGDRIRLTVTDTGKGFDVEKVLAKDPTDPEAILKSRGRGIFIMRSMMDEVDFVVGKPKGTKVHLVKFLESQAADRASEA